MHPGLGFVVAIFLATTFLLRGLCFFWGAILICRRKVTGKLIGKKFLPLTIF